MIVMPPEKDKRLHNKRDELQLRIRLGEFINAYILPFAAILEELIQLKINFEVVESRCIPLEFHEHLAEPLQKEPLSVHALANLPFNSADPKIDSLMEQFPSVLSLRYQPDLPVFDIDPSNDDFALKQLIQKMRLNDTEVFLCYLNMPFVIKTNLTELAERANDEIFNTWQGDAVIFPNNSNWLIAYSLEEEWRYSTLLHQQSL